AYRVVLRKESETAQGELDSDHYPDLRELTIGELRFLSKPGLYGWNKIDQGSALLVETFKAHFPSANCHYQRCLDLGCGYGYLMLATKDYAIEQRVATDN